MTSISRQSYSLSLYPLQLNIWLCLYETQSPGNGVDIGTSINLQLLWPGHCTCVGNLQRIVNTASGDVLRMPCDQDLSSESWDDVSVIPLPSSAGFLGNSIFELSLPLFPIHTGTDTFNLFEHPAEIIQFSNTAGKAHLLYRLICKPEKPFGMSDADVLEIGRDAHPKLLFEDVDEVVFADVEIMT